MIAAFAWNHEGLGHVNRLLAVAEEIEARSPDLRTLFFVEQPYDLLAQAGMLQLPVPVCDADFVGLARTRRDPRLGVAGIAIGEFVREVVRTYDVRAILHDAVLWGPLFDAGVALDAPQALILRERTRLREYLAELGEAGRGLRRVIVPHARSTALERDFAQAEPRPTYVGPIARRRRTQAPPDRRDTAVGTHRRVLVTAGGGGYADVGDFLQATLAALATIAVPLAVEVVTGPLFRGRFELPVGFPHGCRVAVFEPYLDERIARASVVVAQGGYNTVNELRRSGTAAVVVPSARAYDDQLERTRRAAGKGTMVVHPLSESGLAEAVRATLDRPRVCSEALDAGRQMAARELIALAASTDAERERRAC
jgi:predicted glycosyltransferase